MDSKMVLAIGVAIVVIAGGVAAAVVLTQNNKDSGDSSSYFDGVGLKVLGNVNKDNVIDSNDYNELKKLIDDGKSADDNKLADANNDGKLDDQDLAVIQNVIDKKETKIYHVVYHDTDGDGVMDTPLKDTKYPVSSTVMSGSSNLFIMFYMLGITNEVKGASYGDTNDTYLYNDVYFHYDSSKKTYSGTENVKRLGTSSTTIAFENGQIGSTETIAKENVTCVISDWNRTYITNEDAFETAGIDVVRVASASFDPEVYTHSIALLGLLFDKGENASKLISLYDKTRDDINKALKDLPAESKKKAVASSMDGAISSADSDYTAVCVAAGAEFGLKGFDFGGSTSIYVKDNLGVFDTRQYNFDNIVHLRTALTYASTPAEVASYWATYANAMDKWEKAFDGQVLVSGSIPVPARVAYTAYAIYGSTVPALSEAWASSLVGEFESMYTKDAAGAPNHTLALKSYNYEVTVSDDVIVKNGTTVVTSGEKFAYGTQLHIEPKVVKEGFILAADGSVVDDDGNFLVINNINARYVDPTVIAALQSLANGVKEKCANNLFIQTVDANAITDGSVTVTNPGSSAGKTGVYDSKFVYYEDKSDAASAYAGYKSTVGGKTGTQITLDVLNGSSEKVGEVFVVYQGKLPSSATAAYKAYGALNITGYCGNYVLDYAKTSYYYNMDDSMSGKTQDEINTIYGNAANALAAKFVEVLTTVA